MSKHIARKRFGQNFLVDQQVIADIVNAVAPQRTDCVVEIGPGLGALTDPLLQRLNHLHVVEIDRDIIARLKQRYAPKSLAFTKVMHWLSILHSCSRHQGASCTLSVICLTTFRHPCFFIWRTIPSKCMKCTSCCRRKLLSAWWLSRERLILADCR